MFFFFFFFLEIIYRTRPNANDIVANGIIPGETVCGRYGPTGLFGSFGISGVSTNGVITTPTWSGSTVGLPFTE